MIIKSKVFLSLVGKCTNCSSPYSFIISIKISPSDGLNGEPDLLSLSGQTMSPKLKSPRTWTEVFFSFMHTFDLLKLTSQQVDF